MFCERCLAITDDTPAPSTFTLNLVGTGLFGWGTPCRDCRSVGKILWICFVIPVIPLARYRVIHTGWGRYVGRRRISERRRQRLAAAGYVPLPADRVVARAIRFQGVLARVKLRAHRPNQALWFLDRGIRAALVEHGPRHPDTAVLVSTLRVVPKASRLRRRRLEREVEEYLQSAGL